MEYQVRRALETEKECIYNLKKNNNYHYIESIWGWNEEYQRTDFENDWTDINRFYCIDDKGRLIGFYQVNNSTSELNIEELHIHPDYRGRGIGTTIIQNVIQQAQMCNQSIMIGCFKQNVGALKLYENNGFLCEIETETHYILRLKP
jgi:ribosomal protein S18 acetylase RimI-like enzyme